MQNPRKKFRNLVYIKVLIGPIKFLLVLGNVKKVPLHASFYKTYACL